MNFLTSKTLNNGVEMPRLGFGVFQSGGDTKQAALWALEAGYRHIDTAKAYHNEDAVGEAIKESGIDRKELFITTKLWNQDMRDHTQRENIEKSLEYLQTDYLDLLLIHWPVAGVYKESWKIMEEFYKEGKIRAIGVSNFQMGHLMDLMAHATVVPVVNQIECHPYLSQQPLCSFCRKTGIQVTAWAPLGRAKVFEDAVIKGLAEKYGRTPAQVILRWELQRGIIVIPKSVHRERIIENSKIFDFELVSEDMAVMDGLNKDQRFGPSPDTFDF